MKYEVFKQKIAEKMYNLSYFHLFSDQNIRFLPHFKLVTTICVAVV